MLVSVSTSNCIVVVVYTTSVKTLSGCLTCRRLSLIEGLIQPVRIFSRDIQVLVRTASTHSLWNLLMQHGSYPIIRLLERSILVCAPWRLHEGTIGLLHLREFVISLHLHVLLLLLLSLIDVHLVSNIEGTRCMWMVPLLLYGMVHSNATKLGGGARAAH
jgi:hypothetical protein